MSIKRWAAKRDIMERPIIEALEKAGCEVWVIERPVDLLTLYHGRWLPLEVKSSPYRPRKDQPVQVATIARTRIPVVTSPLEALKAIGATHV